jgi:iron complex outermembrane receptor protein
VSHNNSTARRRTAAQRTGTSPLFKLTPLASLLAGAALFGPAAWAAEGDLQVAQANTGAPTATSADPAAAEAPRALEAVVVRSRNRIEKLQDVPLSVSVVTGAELNRLNATDISAITKRAGNISWNTGNQRTSSISIRGIGKVGQTEAQDPSVGFMVDGVAYAYNALTSSFDFIDIDTVEVTRGPQGTLLGKNSSMGTVAINTKKPSFIPSADYGLTFKQRDGVSGWFAGGGALVDDLIAYRATFSFSKQRGDMVNTYNRDVTYTNTDRASGRIQFLITPDPSFSARLALDAQPRAGEATNGRTINVKPLSTYNDGSPNTSTTNESRLNRRWFASTGIFTPDDYYNADTKSLKNDAARPLVTGSHGSLADLNWKLDNGYTVNSITATKDYHFNAVNDEGTPFDIYRNSGGFWNDYRQFSQELRLSSPVGGLVDYQTGLYHIRVHNDSTYQRIWGNDAGAWAASDSQYGTLDTDSAGRELLRDSLGNLSMNYTSPAGFQAIRNKSTAGYGQANWHLSDDLTLTTGARLTKEDRRNTTSSGINDQGNGSALNPVSIGSGATAVSLGGFNSDAKTGVLKSGNSADQLTLADSVAKQYFGVDSYGSLNGDQLKQVAAAKAVRLAGIGVVYAPIEAQPFKAWQHAFVLSPSYKLSPNQTTYFSWQYGQKAGIAQTVNGVSALVKAESTNSFELGLKSSLLDRTLVLNTDVFLAKVKDYQQSVRVFDEYTTNLKDDGTNYYTAATGNVPKVQISGLELDGVYSGIRNTTLRFSGAYNKAVYKSFPNAALAVEDGSSDKTVTVPPYHDVSGKTLAGAPRFSGNVGGTYRLPVFGDKEFHTDANVAFSSSYLSDNSLSKYSKIPSSHQVDLGFGLARRDQKYDVSFIVKNALNDTTPVAKSPSTTAATYTTPVARNYAIQFIGKL